MAPNLLLATQTLFAPHRWFARNKPSSPKPVRTTEHWNEPVPGTYEYIPGRGWFLVASDSDNGQRLAVPEKVKYSRVLKRNMLGSDYDDRKKTVYIKDENDKLKQAGFFRLDNGVAWVHCWDEEGAFIPGPYKLWCLDKQTDKFRVMLKGDDPAWCSRRSSRSNKDTRDTPRQSFEGTSREGSYREVPASNPSTRPNSIRERASQPSTRPNSVLELPISPPSTRPSSIRGHAGPLEQSVLAGSMPEGTISRATTLTPPEK